MLSVRGVVVGVDLFFFKQKTAYEMRISDWSSDVCSSDLGRMAERRDPDAAGFCGDTGCQRDRAQGSNPHDHAVSQRAVSKSLTAMTYELTIEPLGASVPIR